MMVVSILLEVEDATLFTEFEFLSSTAGWAAKSFSTAPYIFLAHRSNFMITPARIMPSSMAIGTVVQSIGQKSGVTVISIIIPCYSLLRATLFLVSWLLRILRSMRGTTYREHDLIHLFGLQHHRIDPARTPQGRRHKAICS